MRRTLRTCLLGFSSAVDAGKRVIAQPEIQEVSSLPCDIGSAPELLVEEFGSEKVDFGLVKEGWNDKSPGSPWEPEMAKLEQRARRARLWLRELGEKSQGVEGEVHIVVVSHGGYIHFFTQDWDGMNPEAGK